MKSQQPILYSKELILRPFELADAVAVQSLAGDRLVADTTENIPHPYPDGLAESWISTHKDKWDNAEGVTYAIIFSETDMLIGAVGFVKIVNFEAELGYWVGVPYWGKGYCTNAVRMLVEYGFSDLELKRVYAKHLTKNPASGRVLGKTGFSHIGSALEERWKCEGSIEIEEYEKLNG